MSTQSKNTVLKSVPDSYVERLLQFEANELVGPELYAFFQDMIDNDLLLHMADTWNMNLWYISERLLNDGVVHPKYIN